MYPLFYLFSSVCVFYHAVLYLSLSLQAFRPGKAKLKKKKVSIEDKRSAQPAAPVVDTVGDIFDNVGKYTPFVPTTSTASSSSRSSSSSGGSAMMSPSAKSGSGVTDMSKPSYFKSLKSDEDAEDSTSGSKNVMATVKALMQSQSILGGKGTTMAAPESKKRVASEAESERERLIIEEEGKVRA